jgi:hypothetical protein
MKTTTTLSIIAIVVAVAAAGLVTAISLSTPANAVACNTFPLTTKCSPRPGRLDSGESQDHAHSNGGPTPKP